MVFLKARKTWVHGSTVPLLRALRLGGAAYYLALSLTLGLEIIATTSNEVGSPISIKSHRTYNMSACYGSII